MGLEKALFLPFQSLGKETGILADSWQCHAFARRGPAHAERAGLWHAGVRLTPGHAQSAVGKAVEPGEAEER